jgi:hypothetical protein
VAGVGFPNFLQVGSCSSIKGTEFRLSLMEEFVTQEIFLKQLLQVLIV